MQFLEEKIQHQTEAEEELQEQLKGKAKAVEEKSGEVRPTSIVLMCLLSGHWLVLQGTADCAGHCC